MSRIELATLLGLSLLLPSFAMGAAPPCQTNPMQDSFLSRGKHIRVERFEPTAAGMRPAVVLVHGIDGLEGSAKHYRLLAKQLAGNGHVVLLVHYFDRTDTKKEHLQDLCKQFQNSLGLIGRPGRMAPALRATFEAWMETVRDAVVHVRKNPRVDPERVGLIGFSLGGFLATSVAADPALRIACVVELFGGMPCEVAANLKHYPPTLIIHGDKDKVVPVQQAYTLKKVLQASKNSCEMKIYKDVGHCFVTGQSWLTWLSILDAKNVALTFLSRNLASTSLARKSPCEK